MNDAARLAAHREAETEGSITPAQSRAFPVDDHARPWSMHRDDNGAYFVRDADGLIVANCLSQRDARIITFSPELGGLALQFCEDFDRALTRVGL